MNKRKNQVHRHNVTGCLAAAAVILTMFFCVNRDLQAEETNGLNVQAHTQEEIRQFLGDYKSLDSLLSQEVTYAEKPKLTAPFSAGKLSEKTQNAALKLLNQIRYVAGLDYNVTLNEDYGQKVQTGTLVNALNGELSHTPSCPSGMAADLYELGYSGTSSSNLAWGYSTLNSALLGGWMSDADPSNISSVGHRRWVLNPDMGQTAFGATGTFYGMYSFDRSSNSAYSNVAWPAQNMPDEWFGDDPWSFSTGEEETIEDITVTLVRQSDHKKWTFSKNSSDGEFYVDNGGYGMTGCIIFLPSDLGYTANESFPVKIEGLSQGTVNYTVNFFELYGHNYEEEIIREATCKKTGLKKYTCVNCGNTYTEAIPKTKHDWYLSGKSTTTVSLGSGKIRKEITKFYECLICGDDKEVTTVKTSNKKKKIKVSSIKITGKKKVKAGKKIKLKVKIAPANAAIKTVQWKSSNKKYATVNKNGVVKAKKAGKGKKVKITAKATDGSGKKKTIVIKIR